MHYIPESTCEMLRSDPSAFSRTARSNFHYQSAPLYLLTACVAALLAADGILSAGWIVLSANLRGPSNTSPAMIFGFRFALLAAVLGGARIVYHALDGLLSGRIGTDLALTIACLAAIILGEHQTAGLVVLISLIGESLEGYTIDRARWAVRQTFALQPSVVHLSQDGRERDVPIEDLRVGDCFVVRPAERIPADGKVLSGKSAVDQSAFTGESLPVDIVPGDRVFAGTLNQFGALTIVAENIGGQTALAKVGELVGSASARKTGIERTADGLARWFLPAVLGAALLTWIGWRIAGASWQKGALPALAVLVVACPCPLVLATPAAVMAALAWLAKRGVIVRGSESLERLSRVDTFAFDKTGTLTQGALALGEIIPISNVSSNEILQWAAIAERHSEHLLARLIVKSAEERGLSIPAPIEFETFAGAGVIAKVAVAESGIARGKRVIDPDLETLPQQLQSPRASHTVVVGNRRILNRGDIAFSERVSIVLKERETLGESPLVVAVDGQIAGILTIRETIRPESEQTLRDLHESGISMFALLTGDRSQPADAVVRAMGLFDHVATEQLPADKARWIEEARQSGRHVAMVGDGVNDAPALASADVGLVIARAGADLAAEAGDILLLGDPLRPLPGLVRLSRALVQNIRQSITLFAFGMNGLGVLACSLGWLSPVGGALFHEAASLAVMMNAMRLLWFDGWASSSLSRWHEYFLLTIDRVAVAASPSSWVYWLLERWQLTGKLIAAMAFVVWMLSGVVRVGPDEQVLVTRFGRYQSSLMPGLYWRWPWPMEQLVRESVDRVRAVPIGFRSRTVSAERTVREILEPGIVEWTSSHDDRESSGAAEESLLLTSDEVPVEMTAEVTYRIRDLRQFRFGGTQRPEDVLRATAEGVLRDLAAQASLDQLLTDHRRELERRSLVRLRQRIDSYKLGIDVLDLQWLDVHPPKAVVPAYRQVADALEERELLINEAEAYADRILLGAVGEDAVRLLKQSPRLSTPSVTSDVASRADWAVDDELWRRLSTPRPDGRSSLSGNAAAALDDAHVAATRRRTSAQASALRIERLFTEYLNSPQLTSQRLYWDSMIDLFSKRSLTIIDPRATNRQQLWIGDAPTVPSPVVLPPPIPERAKSGE